MQRTKTLFKDFVEFSNLKEISVKASEVAQDLESLSISNLHTVLREHGIQLRYIPGRTDGLP